MTKRVLIPVGPEFQDEEFIYPYYRFLEAGFHVDIASTDGNIMFGKYGTPARTTIEMHRANADWYDCIFIPGGNLSPEKLRMDKNLLQIVRDMFYAKKVVAAICHGPWVLASAGILRGMQATCYEGIKDDISNAGANYRDEGLVEHDNLITAPHYRNNPDIMKAILRRFQ